MNRERAETFLRLLAEAEMRDPMTRQQPARRSPDAPFITLPVKVARVAWALAAVNALDGATAETILSDVEMALAARMVPEAGPGPRLTDPVWPSGPVPQRFPLLRPPGVPGQAGGGPDPGSSFGHRVCGGPGPLCPAGADDLVPRPGDQRRARPDVLRAHRHRGTPGRHLAGP